MIYKQEQTAYDQQKKDPVVKADLGGKVVIVVGANVGLGYETAKHFATMQPKKLILACRDEGRGKDALSKLQEETGFDRAELRIVDLASFPSVQSFADKFNAEHDRLDILIANAAVAKMSYEVSAHGFETTIQVNNLSTDLLSILLLPKMIETARQFGSLPRLVIVSSDIHYYLPSLDPKISSSSAIHAALSDKEYCTPEVMGTTRYTESKLLNVFFLRELHARLPASQPTITVNGVSPGFCLSALRRDVPEGPMAEQYREMERTIAFTSEEGARHIVWAALAHAGDEEEKMRGAYTSVSEIREESDYVISEEGRRVQRVVWDDMVRILNGVDPRVSEILGKYTTQ